MLAGGIITFYGGFNALWINALSFFATLISKIFLPKINEKLLIRSNNLKGIFADLQEGYSWLSKDKLNFVLSLQDLIGNFGASAVLGVLMHYMLSHLQLSTHESGINNMIVGLGGVLGGIIIIPLENMFRRGVLIPVLLGIGCIGLTFAMWSNFWLIPGISFGIAMVCNITWNTMVQSVRQDYVPKHLLGRVLSISRVFTGLAMPLGAMGGGIIYDIYPIAIFGFATLTKAVEVYIALKTPINKL